MIRWQSGTLPSGNIPREIVEDVFEKLTEEIGHYPKTPDLEEHVLSKICLLPSDLTLMLRREKAEAGGMIFDPAYIQT